MPEPEIYIHVGMGRAGSTFLQYRVFPKLKGLQYIQRTRFRKARKIIAGGRHSKYLVSGELDPRIIEDYLKDFSNPLSWARPIMVIRRHDEWIASQYRRYLKNGNHWTFSEFFDLDGDSGYWKKDQLFYYPLIGLLEKYFDHKPLILKYDDLRKDPEGFIRSIADYMGASLDMDRVDTSSKHASYRQKQLRLMYSVSSKINLVKKRPFSAKWKNVLVNIWKNVLRYTLLYLSPVIPGRQIPSSPIFPDPEHLSGIRKAYEEDWQKCVEYAEKNNPVLRSKDGL
jgi:hypothetical protein